MFQGKVDRYLILTLAIPLLYCAYYLVQGKFLLKGNSDMIDLNVPYFVAVNDAVSTDIIPSWTRFTFTGFPLIGSPTLLWYPPNWVSFIVAKNYVPVTMTLLAWLHFIGVALAAFMYFREISKSSYWASVSAIAYTFSLPVMYGLTCMVSYLPNYMFTLLALYVIHTAADRSWKLNVVYIALMAFAIITGGFIQMAFYSITLIFLYSIVVGVFGTETHAKDRRVILCCLGGIVLGVLLSAPMLLPLFVIAGDTTKSYVSSSMYSVYKSFKTSPMLLCRLFAPNIFGFNLLFPEGSARGNYVESMNAFCGVAPLFLAGYAITVRRSPVVIFWSFIFLVLVLIAMTPLAYLHVIAFGCKKVMYNRITWLLPMAITALAAIAGLHIDSENRIVPKKAVFNPFWAIFMIAATYGVPGGDYMGIEIVRGILFVYVLVLCSLYLCKRNKVAWHLIVFCLVLIEVVWSGHLMTKVQVYPLMVEPGQYYTYGNPRNPFPLSGDNLEQFRVVLQEKEGDVVAPFGAKEANQGIFYGYMSPWGYNNAFSSRLAFLSRRLYGPKSNRYMTDRILCFDAKPPYDRLADLASVGFVMDPNPEWHIAGDRRGTCIPRASLFFECETYGGKEEAVERLISPDFPVKQKVVLTSRFNATLGPPDPTSSVKFIKNGNSHIVLWVKTGTPAVLLLTDVFARGWGAYVDDREVDIMEGDIAFRAVHIPAGEHRVEFKYLPPMLKLSLWLSLFSIFICATLYIKRNG